MDIDAELCQYYYHKENDLLDVSFKKNIINNEKEKLEINNKKNIQLFRYDISLKYNRSVSSVFHLIKSILIRCHTGYFIRPLILATFVLMFAHLDDWVTIYNLKYLCF